MKKEEDYGKIDKTAPIDKNAKKDLAAVKKHKEELTN